MITTSEFMRTNLVRVENDFDFLWAQFDKKLSYPLKKP